MKKNLIGILTITLMFMLAACGAQKNDLQAGQALIKEGNCAAAQAYLDATIAEPGSVMDMAYAYYLKGVCAEKNGLEAEAFENYYAAKKITCYEVGQEMRSKLNTYARSEYCQRIIPEKLKELEPKVGPEQVQAITSSVDERLNERYMERFNKRLSN